MITTNEPPNKRQRAESYESPNANYIGLDYELQRDSYGDNRDQELLHLGYESLYNYELVRRNYELRATTLPGYVSRIRPKSVGIDAPPTELIQDGKRKRKPKHYYWQYQNDASQFTGFNMLLFILMNALLATEPYEPTSYDDARYRSGK